MWLVTGQRQSGCRSLMQGNDTNGSTAHNEMTGVEQLARELSMRNRALEKTTDGIAIADALADDMPLIYVNAAFERLTGYSADELLGRNCRFLQRDDVDQPGLEALRRAYAAGRSVRVVLRNYRKDGTLFWNELDLTPYRDQHGRLTEYIATQRDVSERVRSESALREAEQNLRAVLEATESEVIAVDEQGRTLFHNLRGRQLAPYPFDGLVDACVVDGDGRVEETVPSGDELTLDRAFIQRRIVDPESYFERRAAIDARPEQPSCDQFRWDDGRIVRQTSTPLRRDGMVAGRVWRYVDVTAFAEVQRELELATERLLLGQTHANIGTWDLQLDSGGVYWTGPTGPMFGLSQADQDTTLENVIAAIYPEDRDAVRRALDASIEADTPYQCEHRVVWPDGSVHWVMGSGAAVRDAQGRAVRVVGVLQDIDERKRADISLRAAQEEAERANQAKSAFLSSMSHELRTPMNAVLGFAQLLEYDDSLAEDQRESVREIIRAGNHLLSLINSVLDLSKIESGHVDLSMEPVGLAPVVKECFALLRPLAAERGITLTVAGRVRRAVRADRMRLKQSLLNLLSNAVKYNRPDGTVTVSVADAGERLRIAVTDTGEGLDEAELQRLFEPFERLRYAGTAVEGTGIGLTITRRLVGMMGGTVEAHSEPGQGMTFCIELKEEPYPWMSKRRRRPRRQRRAPRPGGAVRNTGSCT